jgi:molecular chaperone GrpE
MEGYMARDNGDHDENADDDIKINGNRSDSIESGLPDEQLKNKISSLEQMLEEKNNSYNDLYERYLRIAADFDNFKKRMTKEKTDLVSYGNEELIKALLNVIDNLERALDHQSTEGNTKSLIVGVDLVYKQFLSILEKFGLERINAEKGSKFDPNYHQAVEHIETDDITPGSVINEMIKGYLLKERLLRPSMVAVSKGLRKSLATEKLNKKQDNEDLQDKPDVNKKLNNENEKVFEINDSENNEEDKVILNVDIENTNNNNASSDEDILDLVDEDDYDEKQ